MVNEDGAERGAGRGGVGDGDGADTALIWEGASDDTHTNMSLT